MSPELVAAPVFLSSLTGKLNEASRADSPLLALRSEIKEDHPHDVWVAEIDGGGLKSLPSLQIVDACIEKIKISSMVLILLGEKREGTKASGTPVPMGEFEALVSYFEIEVFQAALHSKPVVIIQMDDYLPPPRMVEFIGIMKSSGVVIRWEKDVTYGKAREVAGDVIRKAKRDCPEGRGMFGALVRELVKVRARLRESRQGLGDVRWLNGQVIASTTNREANVEHAKAMLAVARQVNATSSQLSRLYMVATELMALSPLEEAEQEVLELWSEVLGQWGSTAAWYGLHNHLATGVIASLSTRQDVVRSIARRSGQPIDEIPLAGALASAYYSEGKNCAFSPTRFFLWRTGLCLANSDVASPHRTHPGIFAIRGCLRASVGNLPGAFMDFKKLHNEAISLGDVRATAEGLTYLGRYYGLVRMNEKARSYLEEAVRLHENHDCAEEERAPFVAKALKNLLAHYHSRGLVPQRDACMEHLREICMKFEILDQLDQANEVIRKG